MKHRVSRIIALALCLVMLFTVMPAAAFAEEGDTGFTDVQADDWFAGAVEFAVDRGLFKGVGDGLFAPDADMSNAMVWTMLARFDGQETEGGETWYSAAQSWTAKTGISDGAEPEAVMTREEFATALYRYARVLGAQVKGGAEYDSFADAADVSAEAADAVKWAVGNGLLEGDDENKLNPQAGVTRACAAAVMQRCIGLWEAEDAIVAKSLPNAADMVIDPDNYYGQVIEGYYSFDCVVNENVTRTAKIYVPAGTVYNQPTVFVMVPSGVDSWDFFVESGWKDVADEEIIHVILMEPGVSGQWGDIDDEIAYITALNEDIGYRPFICTFTSNFYAVAYGDAADILRRQSVENPKNWAGIAVLGTEGMTAEEVTELQNTESKVPGVSLAEAQTPIWIVAAEETEGVVRLVDFYKSANHSQETGRSLLGGQLYEPQEGGTVDDQWCANVYYKTDDWNDCLGADYSSDIYNEMFLGVYRYPGDANGALRRPGDIFDRGFKKFEEMVPGGYAEDGSDLYQREWYVYVPDSVDTSEPAPLVFVFHGAGGSGNEIADRSGWAEVADANGFIIVMPTGSHILEVRNVSNMQTSELFRAMWNTGDATETRPSDLELVRYIFDWMCENYNIDTTRVYASGQSSGGAMSWACATYLSDIFAAAAPVSAGGGADIATGRDFGIPEDASYTPIINFLGLQDNSFRSGYADENGKAAIDKWTEFFNTVERYDDYTYNDGGQNCSSVDGLFTNYVFHNADGVPMFRGVEVTNKTHAIWPSECYTAWSEWFVHYSKDADGTLYYDGVAVK